MAIIIEKDSRDSYPGRLERLASIKSYDQVFYDTFISEPHTAYNLSHLLEFLPKSPSKRALCVGYCFLKESTLIKENYFKSIETWDIDSDMVPITNDVLSKLAINSKLLNLNILKDEIKKDEYDTLLLFQMDYIFSDRDLVSVIKKAIDANIKECIVISPSLLHLSFPLPKEKNIFFHDLVIFLQLFIKQLKKKNKRNSDKSNMGYKVYTRFKNSYLKLFSQNGYKLKKSKVTMNNNGSFHYMYFDSTL